MYCPERAYCRYIAADTDDSDTEALQIFLPVGHGYINYNLVHSVIPQKRCDTWRLGPSYHCECDLKRETLLTRPYAEWEMAIRLRDRPDFIGGAAHGDEVYQRISVWMDGEACEWNALRVPVGFDALTVEVQSVGYDPSDPSVAVLRHTKIYEITRNGICVDQRVEWLCDVPLGQSYMAMMPPLKTVTDHYQIEDQREQPITERNMKFAGNFSSLTLRGQTGFRFTMSVPRYLGKKEAICLITDNGGDQYNKMYFVLGHGGKAACGEIWGTTTEYQICYSESRGSDKESPHAPIIYT